MDRESPSEAAIRHHPDSLHDQLTFIQGADWCAAENHPFNTDERIDILDQLNERCSRAVLKDEKLEKYLGVADEHYGPHLSNDERIRFSQGFIIGWQAAVKLFEITLVGKKADG